MINQERLNLGKSVVGFVNHVLVSCFFRFLIVFLGTLFRGRGDDSQAFDDGAREGFFLGGLDCPVGARNLVF